MSESFNRLPESEMKSESFNKMGMIKDVTEKVDNTNHAISQTNNSALESSASLSKSNEFGSIGVEVGNSEIEYIESENLSDLEDVNASLNSLLERLDSKDWILVCESLNDVRRISIFHKEAMLEMLHSVLPLVVKSLKSPRSALCKTAIMTTADIFKIYGDLIIDSFDPLLLQLLLKSAQDKRFVCEAAERALMTLTSCVSPHLLLPKLQPYLKHKNPRIRAKAAMCFSRSVPQLGVEGINAYGMDTLIRIAASQLSDRLPESREAARSLALELQTVYEKSHVLPAHESEEVHSWADFCQAKLSPLSAQAILRVTSTVRERLVVGC